MAEGFAKGWLRRCRRRARSAPASTRRRAAGAVGAARRRGRAARVLPNVRRGVRRGGRRWSSRRSRSSSGTVRPGWRSSSVSWPRRVRPASSSIADAKRGDIDSTAEAYAEAWLTRRALWPRTPSPRTRTWVSVRWHRWSAWRAHTVAGLLVVAEAPTPRVAPCKQARTADGTAVEDMLPGRRWHACTSPGGPRWDRGCGRRRHTGPSDFELSQLGGVILGSRGGGPGSGSRRRRARFAGCPRGSVLPSSSRRPPGPGPDPVALRDVARSLARELAAAMA